MPLTGSGTRKDQSIKKVCLVMVEVFLVVEPVETIELYSQCGNHGKGAFDRLRHRERFNQSRRFVCDGRGFSGG